MSRFRLREIVACAVAFMLGSVAAFFGVGPALFADGQFKERLVVFAITVLVELVLGVLVGAFAGGLWKTAAACLVLPLVPVIALFGREALSNPPLALLVAGFLLGCTAAALLGALIGVRLRNR